MGWKDKHKKFHDDNDVNQKNVAIVKQEANARGGDGGDVTFKGPLETGKGDLTLTIGTIDTSGGDATATNSSSITQANAADDLVLH